LQCASAVWRWHRLGGHVFQISSRNAFEVSVSRTISAL
jgi:hypothetical protein